MIYRMACDLDANLKARKYPVRVEYAPRSSVGVCGESGLILVERDTVSGDSVGFAPGVQSNPRRLSKRMLGVQVTIFAQSTLSGAMQNDHEHECDAYVDAFLGSLDVWAHESGAGAPEYGEARYLSAQERTGALFANGVEYRIKFRIARGVVLRDYDGAAQPTATIARVTNTTALHLQGAPEEDP